MDDLSVSERVLDIGRIWAGGLSKPIYLDHHATTPVDPRVAKVVVHAMTEAFGNANSVEHVFGEVASELVAMARDEVAALVDAAPEDVRFTSGSSEAIRLALAHAITTRRRSTSPLRVALSRVEHKAVLDAVEGGVRSGLVEPVWIDVDMQARIDMSALENALGRGIELVCFMAANNEVGTVYPVEEAATLARRSCAAILVDATQAAGRLPLSVHEWHLDYLVLSAHKLYGPKGVGALVAPSADLGGVMTGLLSSHEGTPNVPGIAGMGEACQLRRREMEVDEPRIAMLRDRLEAALLRSVSGLVVNGDLKSRLSNNLHVSVPGVLNDAVVAKLHRRVAISTGAACASGAQTSSHVLRAMGLSSDLQEGALRISLGKFNMPEEIGQAAIEIAQAINDVRASLDGDAP
jgi:cysteine desulfurase